ncbi:hydroxyethylthiazole kinase [Thalassobacillus hwangdonensis]|uniref:Hydroxyethylthiazole kinase n=1 Tax=Thalassobacillus hwangdonensis TaxID=546108 RepID=A0ABW3L5U9_9BACI
MNEQILQEVREKQPLIHHLTNQVVMNFTANGLLSFGGTPIMAKEVEEAGDMAFLADGVLINIGTVTSNEVDAMIKAGKAANEKGIPVVLDPVGVAATSFRKNVIDKLLKEVRFTAIKGNAGEMGALVGEQLETKGVDAVGEGDSEAIAQQVAQTYKTVAVVTGAKDVIHDGETCRINETGHPILAKVTGGGCLLGSILTACLTTSGSRLDQAYTAVAFYGASAAHAASSAEVNGSGSFVPVFIDSLSAEVKELRA